MDIWMTLILKLGGYNHSRTGEESSSASVSIPFGIWLVYEWRALSFIIIQLISVLNTRMDPNKTLDTLARWPLHLERHHLL